MFIRTISLFVMCVILPTTTLLAKYDANEMFFLSKYFVTWSEGDIDIEEDDYYQDPMFFNKIMPVGEGPFITWYNEYGISALSGTNVSPWFHLTTTWRTVGNGANPLLFGFNTLHFGSHSGNSGNVQLRVIRAASNPAQVLGSNNNVSLGTSFQTSIPRGTAFEMQARVSSGSGSFRFESFTR